MHKIKSETVFECFKFISSSFAAGGQGPGGQGPNGGGQIPGGNHVPPGGQPPGKGEGEIHYLFEDEEVLDKYASATTGFNIFFFILFAILESFVM